jgi:hypothetical protein
LAYILIHLIYILYKNLDIVQVKVLMDKNQFSLNAMVVEVVYLQDNVFAKKDLFRNEFLLNLENQRTNHCLEIETGFTIL